MIVSETYFLLYVSLVRALINELNTNALAGLITHRALPLISQVDQHTIKLERLVTNAQAIGPSQQ